MISSIDDEINIEQLGNKAMMVPKQINEYTLFKKLKETFMCVVFSLTLDGYVMKCIPIRFFQSDQSGKDKEKNREIEFLTEINHKNIIHAERHFSYPEVNPRFMAILMPRAKCDLDDYIRENKGKITEGFVWKVMCDVVNGLEYLHTYHIWHRDIKPHNIFLMDIKNDVPEAVIADLGFARQFGNGFFEADGKGTIAFAAPEMLMRDEGRPFFKLCFRKKARYCCNADIFSLGVVMYNLLTGKHPFFISKDVYDDQNHLEGRVEFNGDTPVSFLAQDLINQMLSPNPYDRPFIQDVKNHPWFEQFRLNQNSEITSIDQWASEAKPILEIETNF